MLIALPLSTVAYTIVTADGTAYMLGAETENQDDLTETTDTPDKAESTDTPDTTESDSDTGDGKNELQDSDILSSDIEDDLQTPDVPETADMPEIEETEDTPDTPDTPETPDEPETQDEPEPETYDEPDIQTDTDNDTDSEPEPEPEPEPDPEPEPEPPVDTTLPGDVNGDGVVNSEDALMVLRHSVGLSLLPQEKLKYADINGDGAVDSSDAFGVLRVTILQPDEPDSSSKTAPAVKEEPVEAPDTPEVQGDSDFSAFSRGIDVSMYQGSIDFNRVKADGIDFVIIRAGYGRDRSQKDPYFEQNYARAKAAGLKVGAYWYSYAVNAADAAAEAQTCMWAIQGKQFDYPIYFDLEESWQLNSGMNFCTALVTSFCNTLEANGYYAGFYTSTYYARRCLTQATLERYAFWVAEWSDKLSYGGSFGMWQYGGGYVDGVNGYCDLDYSYIDYAEVMRVFHLNGY